MQRRLLLLLCTLHAIPVAASAQEVCPGGRISEIVVRNHSIFPPDALPAESRILWAYRLANFIHIPTRAEFIREELLFRPGDCLDQRAVDEAERILREFRFIAAAHVTSEPGEDGGRTVFVETRDEWTTKAALYARFEDGIRFEGVSLYEENLLGRGITVGVFRVDRDEVKDTGMALEIPRLGGSNLDASVVASRTLAGNAVHQMIVRPFLRESRGIAFRQRIDWREDLFSYVLPPALEYSHMVVPVRTRKGELTWGRRFGDPGDLRLVGGGLSVEHIEVGGVGEAEGIRTHDFASATDAVDGDLASTISTQTASRQALRLNLLLGTRRIAFETREGLDALAGVQDIPTGGEVIFYLGRSIGSTGAGRPGDLFARSGGFLGLAGEAAVLQARVTVEGRREDGSSATGPAIWRDILTEGHLLLYLTPSRPFRQTIVFRGAYQAGWRTTTPFQITLGGASGVRGYRDTDFPGGERTLYSLESRIPTPSPFPDLMDFGVTFFGDLGRVRPGDAPFGADSGWRGTLGTGIRIGFPAGTSSVIRADLAFPIGSGIESRKPVIRISAIEMLGTTGIGRSTQIGRSRRSGIGSQFVGVARDRVGWWP